MLKNELEIDVGRCIGSLFKKKKFIGLITVLFLLIGTGVSLNAGEDRYTAIATVYASADGSYVDASNAVTAMNAYLNVAKSYKVSQRAALIMGRSDVSPTDVQEAVSVSSSATTSKSSSSISNFMNSSATIITFSAESTDPAIAMEMADAMAQSYAIEMSAILKTDSVKTLDNAYTYTKSYDSTLEEWKLRFSFMVTGFVLACLIVAICEVFDRKIRTIHEATVRENIPLIGIIPDYKE